MSDVDLLGPREMEAMAAPVMEAMTGGNMLVRAGNNFVTAQRVAVPRNLARVLQDITTLAAAAGSDWFYAWDAKNQDGTTSEISGLTVKGANAVARIYGNDHLGISEVQEGPTHWVFKASFVDLETGFTYERPFRQRRSQAAGKKMQADRTEDIAFQIGASKAIRNCVVNALETFANHAFDEARRSLVDKIGRRLDEYRGKCLQRFAELAVPIARVERLTGKPAAQWNARDVAKIIAQLQAVFDGMAAPADLWPAEVQDPGEKVDADGVVTDEPAADKATSPPPGAAHAPSESRPVVTSGTTATPDLKPPGTAPAKPKATPKPRATVPPPPPPAVVEATDADPSSQADPEEDREIGHEQGDQTETGAAADDDFPGDRKTPARGSLGGIPPHLDRRNPTNISGDVTPAKPTTAKAPPGLFGKE